MGFFDAFSHAHGGSDHHSMTSFAKGFTKGPPTYEKCMKCVGHQLDFAAAKRSCWHKVNGRGDQVSRWKDTLSMKSPDARKMEECYRWTAESTRSGGIKIDKAFDACKNQCPGELVGDLAPDTLSSMKSAPPPQFRGMDDPLALVVADRVYKTFLNNSILLGNSFL